MKIFLKKIRKIFVFFTKYTSFAEKMFLHGKKVLYLKKKILLKKAFFKEKNINGNITKIYPCDKYVFIQKIFVSRININLLQVNIHSAKKI